MTNKISDRIKLPNFSNESDEADWWFDNCEERGKIMAKAMEEGCTLTMKQVLERHGIDASEITVQVAPEDIARARAQAARGGLRYEEYIRQVLHQALVTNDAGSQG